MSWNFFSLFSPINCMNMENKELETKLIIVRGGGGGCPFRLYVCWYTNI